MNLLATALPRSLVATGLAVISSILFAPFAAAQSNTVSFQGHLTDAGGAPLEGAVAMIVCFYAFKTGGVAIFTDVLSPQLTNGLFDVQLGDDPGNPFPAGLFDTPILLGISVNGDPETTPRRRQSSVHHAFRSDDACTAAGLSAASLNQSQQVDALQTDVGALQADVTTSQAEIAQLQGEVGLAETDIAQLQSDLNGVENALPTLQQRVTGTCGSGTAAPGTRLSVVDGDWQMSFDNPNAGGNEWYIGSSADSWGAGGGKLVLSPTGGGFVTLGETGGNNIAIGSNEIMARSNGSTATLALNAEGGKVTINANGDSFADALEIRGVVPDELPSLLKPYSPEKRAANPRRTPGNRAPGGRALRVDQASCGQS